MPIDKLQPQFLNLDDDERLISKVEMSDAQNVRTSVDAAGNALVLRNAVGNFSRSEDANILNGSMPAGTNITVGTCMAERLGYLYWFVYNSGTNHTILRYDITTKKSYIVYQDDLLLFNAGTRVTASVIENNNDDVLLYFTDGITSPKKINATVAEQSFSGTGGYPSIFRTGTVEERLLYVTAAKQPPLTPPVINFVFNSDVGQTDIFEKNFQFAYQYIYRDGEESALSPYTELGVSISQLKDGFITNGQRNFFNQINLVLQSSQADVVRIKVYARKGDLTTSTFYLIDEIDNNFNGQVGTQQVSFSDDQAFIPLSTEVQDKIYDNVPQIADAQAIANGRLFYGGYSDGYPNIDLGQSSVKPNYNATAPIYNIGVSQIEGFPQGSGQAARPVGESKRFELDFSTLPSIITEQSKVLVNFVYDWGKIRLINDLGVTGDNNYRFVGTQANNLEALSGMRWQNTSSTNPIVGVFPKGYLNSPPTIKFTSQKGTSVAKEENIPFARIRDGIKLISGGVQVEEVIDIPLGANNASITNIEAANIVIQAITRNYPFFVQPQDGEGGFSKVTTSGNSNVETESAAFRGQGFARIKQTGGGSTLVRQMQIKMERLTLQVDKMVKGTEPCEVDSPESDISRFDFVEGTNSEGINNRIVGLQNNAITKTISNGRNQFPALNDQGDTRDGVVSCTGANIVTGSNFFVNNTDANGTKCFKSGSKHQLGIVLYDDRGRPGGVQKFDTVEIDHTNNRTDENDLDGSANVVGRLNSVAPRWASYYAPVYVGQGSIINKVQYGIGGSYLASNYDGLQGGFGANSQIFLSLRTLQGKSNSYREAYGALIEYKYSQGDRLRIVRYGDNLKTTFEFNITGVESFDSDVNKNPILDRSSTFALNNTTGDFISIESNEDAVGFRPEDILNDESFWNDQCVIEVYRENNAFETDVYFELGEVLEVSNQGIYGTQRLTTAITVNTTLTDSELALYSDQLVYKGDILTLDSDPSKRITVGNVTTNYDNDLYTYRIYFTENIGITAFTQNAMTVSNPDSVFQIDQGDSYFRLRALYVAPAPQNSDIASNAVSAFTQNSVVGFIEDPSVSDFFVSNFTSRGRPFAYQPEARTIKRRGSVTWSDPFIVDSRTLGLSSFNLSKTNFFDYNYEYGSIKGLISYDEVMYVIQERRAGIIPVSRNIIEFGDGKSEITASKNIVGPIQYYPGQYGCNNNPESISIWRDQVFFADVKSGKVLMISQKGGISVLSDLNVDSFFKNNFFSLEESATNRQIIAGVDYDQREFLISADSVNTVVITITDSVTGSPVIGTGAGRVTNDKINTDSILSDTSTYSWDSDPREYQKDQDKFEDSGAGLLIIDTLTSLQSIFLATEFAPTQIPLPDGSTSTGLNTAIPVVLTTSAQAAFSYGTYNQSTQEITLDNTTYLSTTTLGAEVETLGDFTIGYDCYQPRWNNKYTFRPERIQSISDQLYTFKSGRIYEHAEFFGTIAVPRCTYYGAFTGSPPTYSGGARGDAIIEVVSNIDPSMIKAYEALSLEGDSRWSCTVSNTNQSTDIPTTGVPSTEVWQEKEGFYYAPIPRQLNVLGSTISSLNNSSLLFSIGTIKTASTGALLTFKNPINNNPFPLGTTTALYKISGSNLVSLGTFATAIATEKTLTLNAGATVALDDSIVTIANSAIEGDAIRDYYLKIRLSNSSTSVVELYAINAVFAKSPLANQLGQ